MKNWLILLIMLLSTVAMMAQTNPNHVRVNGYYKSNGTYVQPHYRTAPNSTNRDNFSTIGNTNPYTGVSGWVTPDTKPKVSTGNTQTFTPSSYPSYPSTTTTSTQTKPTSLFSTYGTSGSNNTYYNTYGSRATHKLTEKTSLRLYPNSQATVLKRFNVGDKVIVINSSDEWWWEVIYNGERGWVKRRLLQLSY